MNIVKEKFGVKVFVALTLFIFIVSLSFTAAYIYDQKNALTDGLVKNGKLLAGILADASRIGVFSENDELLKDPIDGIFHQEGVLEVAIFNFEGQLLTTRKMPPTENHRKSVKANLNREKNIFQKIETDRSPLYKEVNGDLEFWSPVMSESGYFIQDSPFLKTEQDQENARIIGFVKITMDKKVQNKRLIDLLIEGMVMGVLFWVIGSGGTYFVVSRITKPLNTLIEGVNIIGSGGSVGSVPVETEDEIGKLARAFNKMSDSLKRREEALIISEERLRLLSSRLIEAQEQERRRISKGLHDELGQALALLKHRLRAIEKKIPQNQRHLHQDCSEISHYIDQIIENVRRLSKDLSPTILEDLGLSAALAWLVKNFGKQYAIETSIEIEDVDQSFSIDTQINLYRIFQEALTNIDKHARATHVTLEVTKEKDYILFQIKDDGKGFDVNDAMAKSAAERGMGLAAMHERANMLKAVLEIDSQTGNGTSINLKIPV